MTSAQQPALGDTARNLAPDLAQQTLDSLPFSVLLLDRSGKVLSANSNYFRKSGRSRVATLDQPLSTVVPGPILEAFDLMSAVAEVVETREPKPLTHISYRAPGLGQRLYRCGLFPVEPAPGQAEWRGALVIDDATERTHLGLQVAGLEHSPGNGQEVSYVVQLSAEGKIEDCNAALQGLLGISLERLRGSAFSGHLDPESGAQIHGALARLFESGPAPAPVVATLRPRTGAPLPIEWFWSSANPGDRGTMSAIAIGKSLKRRHTIEEQVVRSEKLASLGVLAGGIAHEIRNPLAVTYSALQIIEAGGPESPLREEALRRAKAGIERASSIIENLLSIARPGSGGSGKDKIDLNEVVRASRRLIENELRQNKVGVREQIHATPVWVTGSANLIQQVCLNLLLNACQAMPDGGRLTVTTWQTRDEAGISVEDTGRGIAESDIEKVFEPFYSRRARGAGTGLGLALCEAVVRQHGGRIEVSSRMHQGSLFMIYLPRKG